MGEFENLTPKNRMKDQWVVFMSQPAGWNKLMEINPPKKGRLIESRSGSASKGDIAGIMGFMSP